MRARGLACTLAIALGGSASAAPAPREPIDASIQAKADVLFEKAQAHYQADEYQAAIELFKSAYELVHDPVYLFNLGQSYRKILDCTTASDYYLRYLDAAKDAPNRSKVEGWVRELQPCVEQRKAERDAAERGAEADRLRRAEEDARRRAALAPTSRTVDLGRTFRIAGIAVGGAGVIGLVVGVAESVHAASVKAEVATACAAGCNWEDERAADRAGTRANTYATIGYVGAGLAAAAGVALYLHGYHRVEVIQIAPQPGGGVVSARLSF